MVLAGQVWRVGAAIVAAAAAAAGVPALFERADAERSALMSAPPLVILEHFQETATGGPAHVLVHETSPVRLSHSSLVLVDARIQYADEFHYNDYEHEERFQLRVEMAGQTETVLDTSVRGPVNGTYGWNYNAMTLGWGSSIEPGDYVFRVYALCIHGPYGGSFQISSDSWLRVLIQDPSSVRGDYDADGDVDLADYVRFQAEFTGPL